MIKYFLNKENFVEFANGLNIIEINNIDSLLSKKNDIVFLINSFNSEYNWDKMFNFNDVIDRIDKQMILFILYYKDLPIGYVFFKQLSNNECFGFNLYVSKKIKRPSYSAFWFYNKVSEKMIKTYNKINVEIEEWNKIVFDIVEDIGYKK